MHGGSRAARHRTGREASNAVVKAETDHHTSRLSFVLHPSPAPLSLSPGSAGSFKKQPVHCPLWGEQRGRDRSLPQHQKGSFSRNLQPAGVGAPTGGWEQYCSTWPKQFSLKAE